MATGGIEQWRNAVRNSHNRIVALVKNAELDDLKRQSACAEWTVAQVLSHLGSQAEIFSLFLEAGISGGDPPSSDAFGPIWDNWNTRSPKEQASECIKANEAFITRVESLDSRTLGALKIDMFGRRADAAGILRMRLAEHAVHTWDIAVAFDAAAQVAGDAVELLLDGLSELAGYSGKAPAEPLEATIITTGPDRRFKLAASDVVVLESGTDAVYGTPSIELPAEAWLRLVYARLSEEHPPRGAVREEGVTIEALTDIFQGV
jgi:uncharacterized protein (TIGR03083 family)